MCFDLHYFHGFWCWACIYWPFVSSFEKCPLTSFAHVTIGLFASMLFSWEYSLYTLEYKSDIRYIIFTNLSHSVSCLFKFLGVSFLILMKSDLPIFSLDFFSFYFFFFLFFFLSTFSLGKSDLPIFSFFFWYHIWKSLPSSRL